MTLATERKLSMMSGSCADRGRDGDKHNRSNGPLRTVERVKTDSVQGSYFQQLYQRRHSAHALKAPLEMKISGTGWSATWRSVNAPAPTSPIISEDYKLAQSADEALRILLGEHVKSPATPRQHAPASPRQHAPASPRQHAANDTRDKDHSSNNNWVRGHSSGAFNLRSSYSPPEMEQDKNKDESEDSSVYTTTQPRVKMGNDSTKPREFITEGAVMANVSSSSITLKNSSRRTRASTRGKEPKLITVIKHATSKDSNTSDKPETGATEQARNDKHTDVNRQNTESTTGSESPEITNEFSTENTAYKEMSSAQTPPSVNSTIIGSDLSDNTGKSTTWKRDTKWTSYRRREGSPPQNGSGKHALIKHITEQLMKNTDNKDTSVKIYTRNRDDSAASSVATRRSDVTSLIATGIDKEANKKIRPGNSIIASRIAALEQKDLQHNDNHHQNTQPDIKTSKNLNANAEELENFKSPPRDSPEIPTLISSVIPFPNSLEVPTRDSPEIPPRHSAEIPPPCSQEIPPRNSPDIQTRSSREIPPALPYTAPPSDGDLPPMTPLSPTVLPDLSPDLLVPETQEDVSKSETSEKNNNEEMRSSADSDVIEIAKFTVQMTSSGTVQRDSSKINTFSRIDTVDTKPVYSQREEADYTNTSKTSFPTTQTVTTTYRETPVDTVVKATVTSAATPTPTEGVVKAKITSAAIPAPIESVVKVTVTSTARLTPAESVVKTTSGSRVTHTDNVIIINRVPTAVPVLAVPEHTQTTVIRPADGDTRVLSSPKPEIEHDSGDDWVEILHTVSDPGKETVPDQLSSHIQKPTDPLTDFQKAEDPLSDSSEETVALIKPLTNGVDARAHVTVTSHSEMRSRSKSVPDPIELKFSATRDVTADMSREDALRYIEQAGARRQQMVAPDARSPLISGNNKLSTDEILAKLREKHSGVGSGLADAYKPPTSPTLPASPFTPDREFKISPYMFSRGAQHTVAPDETLRRIEMIKQRRRNLSVGDALSTDESRDQEQDEVKDFDKLRSEVEQRVYREIQLLKEKRRQKADMIQLHPTPPTDGVMYSAPLNTQSDRSEASDGYEAVTDEYLRKKTIDVAAEEIEWFRHKRQTVDNIFKANIDKQFSGVDQRYAEFQKQQFSRYISKNSTNVAALLGTNRPSRTASRDTTSMYGRRAQSSDRLRRRAEDDDDRFKFYASNPFDV